MAKYHQAMRQFILAVAILACPVLATAQSVPGNAVALDNARSPSGGIHHTNAIEGVWSQLKRRINGTHVHVSRKHLPKYLGEFEYRYNMRGNPEAMFSRLLLSF